MTPARPIMSGLSGSDPEGANRASNLALVYANAEAKMFFLFWGGAKPALKAPKPALKWAKPALKRPKTGTLKRKISER